MEKNTQSSEADIEDAKSEEVDIQDGKNPEADIEGNKSSENNTANSFSTLKTQENLKETVEEKAEKAFKNEVTMILERIKALPSEATELEIPRETRDVKDVYTKLCRVLKVPENSSFLTQIRDEKMDFSYQCLGPVGIIPVTKALIPCNTVKGIDLKYNKLGMESLPAITSLIDRNENIAHLNLAGNGIGKGSSHLLKELLTRCFSVEFLDLSKNDLGDEELEEIAMSLSKTDSVKELVLNTNDFSSAKAPPFSFYISKCSALLNLDLSCCHLEEGAANIFSRLKFLNLVVLNLARCGIPDEAARALASGLRTNKSLQELDISYNVISSKGAVTLAPGLKGSSTLEIMRLAHNPIQGSAATTLLRSAGSNLKLLDLTGIRVNLAFFKTLRAYNKSGRELEVPFGSEIRHDCLTRDLSAPDEGSLSRDNVVTFMEKLADEKGVSLRNTLKNIHALFITQQHEAISAEEEASGSKKDDQKRPDMTTLDFAKGLCTSSIAVPKSTSLKVAELLSEEGFVNMWELIARIKWKPDDLNVKIKSPRKSPPEKSKEKGKGKGKK